MTTSRDDCIGETFCSECSGKGGYWDIGDVGDVYVKCFACQGTGWVPCDSPHAVDKSEELYLLYEDEQYDDE